MNQSLSIILPVHNAQRQLAKRVAELLDVLPDLTSKFELVIVDDCSTDDTEEVAQDLARTYPQVRVVRHTGRRGATSAVQTGIQYCLGEIVFVQDVDSPLRQSDLVRLWELRQDEQLVMARPQPGPIPESLLRRLIHWGLGVEQAEKQRAGGNAIQMIRRNAWQGMGTDHELAAVSRRTDSAMRSDSPPKSPTFLASVKNFAVGE